MIGQVWGEIRPGCLSIKLYTSTRPTPFMSNSWCLPPLYGCGLLVLSQMWLFGTVQRLFACEPVWKMKNAEPFNPALPSSLQHSKAFLQEQFLTILMNNLIHRRVAQKIPLSSQVWIAFCIQCPRTASTMMSNLSWWHKAVRITMYHCTVVCAVPVDVCLSQQLQK